MRHWGLRTGTLFHTQHLCQPPKKPGLKISLWSGEVSDWINEWKSAPSDWSYGGAHGGLGCKDRRELKGGKTDELWVPFYLWASTSAAKFPQTPPIMVPSAPKCQFCLICHLSLKNTPIMLQPHVLASVEVYCWILQKFFKTQHQHVLITWKSYCWYRLLSPSVHNYHVWHPNETMLYILFCNLLLFSLMMSIVSFY